MSNKIYSYISYIIIFSTWLVLFIIGIEDIIGINDIDHEKIAIVCQEMIFIPQGLFFIAIMLFIIIVRLFFGELTELSVKNIKYFSNFLFWILLLGCYVYYFNNSFSSFSESFSNQTFAIVLSTWIVIVFTMTEWTFENVVFMPQKSLE